MLGGAGVTTLEKGRIMIFRFLHKAGLPSDVFYMGALGSIGASILAWSIRNEKNVANAERLGIFIGLWAPTFMLVGHGLHELEVNDGYRSEIVGRQTHKGDVGAENLRQTADAAITT